MQGRPVSSAYLVWGPLVLTAGLFLGSSLLLPWKDDDPGQEARVEFSSSVSPAESALEPDPRNPVRKSARPAPERQPKHPAQLRLEQIIIPVVDLEDTTLEEAIDFLRQRTRELEPMEMDPGKRGISFVVRKPRLEGAAVDAELDPEAGLGAQDRGAARVTDYFAREVSAWNVLLDITALAGLSVTFEEDRLTLLPRDPR